MSPLTSASLNDPALWRLWCQECGKEAPAGNYLDTVKNCACGAMHWATWPKGAPQPKVGIEIGPPDPRWLSPVRSKGAKVA